MAPHKNTQDQNDRAHIKRRAPLLDLFPPITPFETGYIKVDDIHELYWEQSGNKDGIPIVLLHGGPGAGAGPVHRRFFDPDFYNIIIFDQRGAGRSKPLGEIKNNTTQNLITDLETLRKYLNIKKWHIFGGSWGSTLALAYAIQHKERCLSLILRGIFLCEKSDIDWFIYGMQTIFPEAWEQFASIIPEAERNDLVEAYYKRLTDDTDPKTQIETAVRWSLYEGACSSLLPNYETITTEKQKQQALALAKIEAHYFKTQCYSEKNSLLNHIHEIKNIPTTIVQGRYDIICPIKTANTLHQLWPEAKYVVVPDAGHSALDAPLRSCLIEATEAVKTLQNTRG